METAISHPFFQEYAHFENSKEITNGRIIFVFYFGTLSSFCSYSYIGLMWIEFIVFHRDTGRYIIDEKWQDYVFEVGFYPFSNPISSFLYNLLCLPWESCNLKNIRFIYIACRCWKRIQHVGKLGSWLKSVNCLLNSSKKNYLISISSSKEIEIELTEE